LSLIFLKILKKNSLWYPAGTKLVPARYYGKMTMGSSKNGMHASTGTLFFEMLTSFLCSIKVFTKTLTKKWIGLYIWADHKVACTNASNKIGA
jgi:hypothetical protein